MIDTTKTIVKLTYNGQELSTDSIVTPSGNTDRLQWKCDNMRSLNYEFIYYEGKSVDEVLDGLDTSNVIAMGYMFQQCSALTSIPKLDTSNVVNMTYMFDGCSALTSIPKLDTSNANNMMYMFKNCSNLTTIPELNIYNATSVLSIFTKCTNLKNLTLKNIRITELTIGSGTSYGHLLTVDSLVNTIKELWDYSNETTTYKLTMGSANKAKLANVYVKLITPTAEQIAADPYIESKMPCEVCESTDEGAMLIENYATLKMWTIS